MGWIGLMGMWLLGGMACQPAASSERPVAGALQTVSRSDLTWTDSLWSQATPQVQDHALWLQLRGLRAGSGADQLDEVATLLREKREQWTGWDSSRLAEQYRDLAALAAYAPLLGDSSGLHFSDSLWQQHVGTQPRLEGGRAVAALARWTYELALARQNARYLDPVERWAYAEGYPDLPWGDYLYAWQGDTLRLHSYASHRLSTRWARGHLGVAVRGRYPEAEALTVVLRPERADTFSLWLRIPGWAAFNQPGYREPLRYANFTNRKLTLKVNGELIWPELKQGYARLRRYWQPGDSIELRFPLATRQVLAPTQRPGQVAQMRGPVVIQAWAEQPDP